TALNSREPNAIFSFLRDLNSGEVGDAIRRDVGSRIADLIEQLLGDTGYIYAAAGPRMLGDHETAVWYRLNDGITDPGEVGNGLPVSLAIAARALRAALDDMARDSAYGEAVPVVGLPTKLVDHRAQG